MAPWHGICMSCPHVRDFHGREEIMPQIVSHFEEVITQLRHMLATNSGTEKGDH
jgi:hypothetical protein